MAFNRKDFSNTSATGNDVNVFTYGMNGAIDATAGMKASGFFNGAVDVLKKGNVIILSDGATTQTVTVTSVTGATPITVV
jgi:hypothetical protein